MVLNDLNEAPVICIIKKPTVVIRLWRIRSPCFLFFIGFIECQAVSFELGNSNGSGCPDGER